MKRSGEPRGGAAERVAVHLVLADSLGRRCLWPARVAVPEGWSAVYGPAAREACLAHVERGGEHSGSDHQDDDTLLPDGTAPDCTPSGVSTRLAPVPAPVPVDEVRAVIAEVLELPLEAVGDEDDFFALGGNSLQAARLVSRARATLGVHLTLKDFFETRTAEGLAQAVPRPSPDDRPALRPRSRPVPTPLSYAQERMWLAGELSGPGAAYNVPCALRVRGPLDMELLEAALGDVVARHEALRTLVVPGDGDPAQHVVPSGAARIVVERTVARGEEDLAAQLRHAAGHIFDLTSELPLRCQVIQVRPDDHLLLLLCHHIAADGWSVAPLLRDLRQAWTARAAGAAPNWSPLPVQYADYALWQRELLGADDDPSGPGALELAHWERVLTGAPEALELPADRPRPAVPSGEGGVQRFTVDAALHARLLDLARRHDVTLFMVVHAALAVLLTRTGAGEDLPIGSAVAGREDPALEELVGFFVNTLILRTDTGGDPSFSELLRRVREVDLAAFSHQRVPFQKVVERVAPRRSSSLHPLFQVFLLLQNNQRADFSLPGLDVRETPTGSPGARFDLAFYLTERAGEDGRPAGLEGSTEFARDLFDPATVERLALALRQILASAAEDPLRPVSRLDVLTPEQRRTVLETWNDTRCDVPARSLPELFEEQAARTPDRLAVADEHRELTYAQMRGLVRHVAELLRRYGVGPGSLVAVRLPRSVDLVVALHAVQRAGGAYLPLDPSGPPARTERVLADSAPVLVVDESDWAALTEGHDPVGPETAPPGAGPGGDDPAYVIYTSGSTGRPKGVVVSQAAIVNRIRWMQSAHPLDADDRVLQKTPATFDVSVWEFFWPLTAGAALVVVRPDGHRDPVHLARLIRQRRVTTVHFVPSMLGAFLDSGPAADCSSLRRVFCSGEALSAELAARFHTVLKAELHNLYGPTEAAVDVTAWTCRPEDIGEVVPIGTPVFNTRVYVLDESYQPVLPGVVGELFLAGRQLASRYLNRPALTAERFVADPFGEPGSRMYHTGDLCRWLPDGVLEYRGRTDHQMKIRGVRIEPGEVESVLTRHPSVARAVVVAREDVPGDRRLTGYVVPAAGAAPDPALMTAHAAEYLPPALVPSAVVVMDEFPHTSSGKLDRGALPAPVADRSPAAAGRAPASPTEELLARLFGETLELPGVGRDESFFDLGGHSLLAARLAGRIRAELGPGIGLPDLLRAPTVAALAALVESDGAAVPATGLEPLLTLRGEGGRVPLFCVHPAAGIGWTYTGLLPHLDQDVPVYVLQAPGLTGGPVPRGGLRELASQYVARVRRVRPHGPYRLLGWSFGGGLAHETATLLRAEGETVDLLAVLDGYPRGATPAGTTVETRSATGAATRTGASAGPNPQGPELLRELLASLGLGLPPGASPEELNPADVTAAIRGTHGPLAGLSETAAELLPGVFAAHAALSGALSGPAHDGDLLLFVAAEDTTPGRPDAQAWEPYVTGSVESYALPCTHGTMTGPEPLRRVGEVIRARMARLDDR
ncbi:hypothetical protein N566_04855 [Streptomycetaceae bacterium MP113-05]|nr:hypothetical protein N566_04855 [Streptomycetaceae bacterium MP113-05]